MSLFQMRSQLAELGAELAAVSGEIRSKAGDPQFKIDELRTLKQKQSDTEERFNLLKAELDKAEAAERSKLQQQNPTVSAGTDEQRTIAAKADLIRSTVLGRPVSDETRAALGAIPAPHATGGDKFLPTNMSKRLISEPFVKNPLRGVEGMSNIKGLELPKIAYKIDDDDFIGDSVTAKELKLTGDKVSFGRFKSKVYASISDTVLHGSDVELVTYVENALSSGLAAKEKKVSFTKTPKTGEEHMSFYSEENDIKEVAGETKYKAIKAAIADLHEDFRENARIFMTFSDYMDIVETLANGSATLYQAQPEQVLGKPVEFSDAATDPIIGAYNYAHFNYDGDLIYDSDKDVKTGDYLFVLTAWIDHQILLKSAFRIAKVVPTP